MTRRFAIPITTLVGAAALSQIASAQAIDKSQHHLFNPTPREFWRELSADRPDLTESPHTVDAGALQLEMSFVEYSKNGSDHAVSVTPINLKLGLLNNLDVQLVVEPYVRSRVGGQTIDGFGDTQLRFKLNLWGNDGGATAFALLPFVKFPTASSGIGNDEYEGGIAFPFSIGLGDNLGLGLMLQAEFVYDEIDDDYDTEFLHTIVLATDLTDRVGAFIEAAGIASSEGSHSYGVLLNVGTTFALHQNLVLDAGVNVGLHGDVDDILCFTGMTWRF